MPATTRLATTRIDRPPVAGVRKHRLRASLEQCLRRAHLPYRRTRRTARCPARPRPSQLMTSPRPAGLVVRALQALLRRRPVQLRRRADGVVPPRGRAGARLDDRRRILLRLFAGADPARRELDQHGGLYRPAPARGDRLNRRAHGPADRPVRDRDRGRRGLSPPRRAARLSGDHGRRRRGRGRHDVSSRHDIDATLRTATSRRCWCWWRPSSPSASCSGRSCRCWWCWRRSASLRPGRATSPETSDDA